MNHFANLQHAVIDSRFPKLPGGLDGRRWGFAVELTSCEVKTSARGLGDYLIGEFKILATNCPDVHEGEMRSWSQKLNNTMAAGEMLSFLAAVAGMNKSTPTRIDQDLRPVAGVLMQAATDQRNILQGLQVGVETEEIITVTNKQRFVKHHWTALDTNPERWAEIQRRLQSSPNAAPRPMTAPMQGFNPSPPAPGYQPGFVAPQGAAPAARPPWMK